MDFLEKASKKLRISKGVFADFFIKSLFSNISIMAKTRKGGKGTPWTKFVKKIFTELKKKNKTAKLGDAMKEASRRKKEMK